MYIYNCIIKKGILELQPPGKKAMDAKAYNNGLRGKLYSYLCSFYSTFIINCAYIVMSLNIYTSI